ncbi:MAG: tetratricopeptide repeat protein [Caldimonas sp.]
MRHAHRWLLAASLAGSLAALAGCAAGPRTAGPAPPQLFHDARFGPPGERISTSEIFALDDAMRRFLAVDIADQLRSKGKQTGLIEALYHKAQLRLEYDAAKTKNAAESFATRSGNCLSLVVMTAAFARELKLPVTYQSAFLEETWSRTGNLLFASSHVNITVGRRIIDAGTSRDLSPLTIDFLPPEDLRRLRTREIDEATVVAMYANNRAAEALADGRLDDAYAWAREALRHDAGFAGAWNTLGVVYLRHGDAAEGAAAFEHVLAFEPRNTRALSNLAEAYARQGLGERAAQARERLAAVEPYPPFHFFNLGQRAMERSDYAAAREYFAREVERADYYHEFHFWLGLADFQLGNHAAAKKELALAMQSSTTRHQHDIYAAKLAWLRSRQQ